MLFFFLGEIGWEMCLGAGFGKSTGFNSLVMEFEEDYGE
jgi:hypothetical protein